MKALLMSIGFLLFFTTVVTVVPVSAASELEQPGAESEQIPKSTEPDIIQAFLPDDETLEMLLWSAPVLSQTLEHQGGALIVENKDKAGDAVSFMPDASGMPFRTLEDWRPLGDDRFAVSYWQFWTNRVKKGVFIRYAGVSRMETVRETEEVEVTDTAVAASNLAWEILCKNFPCKREDVRKLLCARYLCSKAVEESWTKHGDHKH